MIAVEFARFLGLPVSRRANITDIIEAVCGVCMDARTTLVCVDEIHNLNTRHPHGAEASDTLKYFSERIPATFVYAGISVERAGLLSGTRGEQIAGRFSMVRTGPFRRDAQWTALIAALEDSLRLHHHRPGTLASLALPAPAHRRDDRQPALADPLRRHPGRPGRHREDHQEVPGRRRPTSPPRPAPARRQPDKRRPGMRPEAWTAPPVGYCLQRRADDPHLRDSDLLEEITSLGYHERLASMANYLRRHAPPRQPCTQCGSPADRAIAAHRETCLLAPDSQLPVPVRPLAGEMLASYLGRLAAANHLPVTTLTAAPSAWLTWKYASHRLLPPRHQAGAASRREPAPARRAHRDARHRNRPVPARVRRRPRGPARAITACRRCAAARGITQPVPVHQPAHRRSAPGTAYGFPGPACPNSTSPPAPRSSPPSTTPVSSCATAPPNSSSTRRWRPPRPPPADARETGSRPPNGKSAPCSSRRPPPA